MPFPFPIDVRRTKSYPSNLMSYIGGLLCESVLQNLIMHYTNSVLSPNVREKVRAHFVIKYAVM